MGGFGALNIAMHRPDVFAAVYSMSPGLFDENGLAESQMFAGESLIRAFIRFEAVLSALLAEDAKKRVSGSPQQFALSYGYAFAPNPDRQAPYYDYPFTEVDGQLVRDDEVWQQWESGFGGIADEARQYKDNLLKLKGIVVDYGEHDEYTWIPKGCVYFGEQLAAAASPESGGLQWLASRPAGHPYSGFHAPLLLNDPGVRMKWHKESQIPRSVLLNPILPTRPYEFSFDIPPGTVCSLRRPANLARRARALARSWLGWARISVRPKVASITVMKKNRASSTGSAPMKRPVDFAGLIVQVPAVMAIESAADRKRPSGSTVAMMCLR
jgi:hypothetical protein